MSRNALKPASLKPFYSNRAVEQFAAKPSTPISLRHLINFGRQRKSVAEEGEKLLKSGNFLRTELPTRLSHRLRDMQSLPYIVASHPRLELVYDMYIEAFERIRKFPPILNLEDNDRFCEMMQATLDKHQVVIPELAIGCAESDPIHLPPPALDSFMTRMLRSRISRRIITEQHISLSSQYREREKKPVERSSEVERRVGVVDTQINATEIALKCAESMRNRGGPEGSVPFVVEGETGADFAYLPEHLEFMLFELMKNAAYSTVERHGAEEAKNHPVQLTFVAGARDILVRVSDKGGGIPPWGGLPPDLDPLSEGLLGSGPLPQLTSQRLDLFTFSHMRRLHIHHTSSGEAGMSALRNVGKLAGTLKEQLPPPTADGSSEHRKATDLMDEQMRSGLGLPLAKMFAEYFGGTLEMHTVRGEGSDGLLQVHKFGNAS